MGSKLRRSALLNIRVFHEKNEEQAHKEARLAQINKIKIELQKTGYVEITLKKRIQPNQTIVVISSCGKKFGACNNTIARYTRHGGLVNSLWTKAIERKPTTNFSQKNKNIS